MQSGASGVFGATGLSQICPRVCSESGRRFFEFLDPVFEIVLIDSKLNEVSAQLCDRPLDSPAQMSKLSVNGVEAFELDFYRIETTFYRIKTRFHRIETRSLFVLLSFDRIKTRPYRVKAHFDRIKACHDLLARLL